MSEDLNKLRELATKAANIAPGAWEHDTDNNDGAYGSGPDARHGFSSYFMMDDKGRRLFDSYNSVVAEVHEDDDSAWDENSRRLFDYLAAFNPATALSLIARLQAAEERAEKVERAVKRILPHTKYPSEGTLYDARSRLHHIRQIADAALKTGA